MALGEIFLAAFLQVLFDRLMPDDLLNFARQEGIHKKLKKWRETLSAIGAVLRDAEEKQLTSEAVKQWLDDLEDLAYDVDDMLDTFSNEMLRRKLVKEEQLATNTSKVQRLIRKVKFSFHMKSEIKHITTRLRDISERRNLLGLNDIGTTSTKVWQRPQSSSVLGGATLVGRNDEKAKIIKFLSSSYEPSTVNFHIAAIVGMAGVGKTTLSQFVFNDSNDALEQFNLMAWVCVSDAFDVERVTKAILESVTSRPCDLKEFSNIQDSLSRELAGKKFLIVLDDVWSTCDYDQWTTLQSPFHVGAQGSKIIVTTRDAEVAKIMRATEILKLECISKEDCWKVFEQHAVLKVDNDRTPYNFELLREKIVAKCSGLPLAARALGGLLGCKEIGEWEEILDDKLWSLFHKSNILPVLNLSYHYLPSNLKRCFAYCSIFPNDYEFEEKQLILLWMAEGLIQQPAGGNKQLEDLGADYFQELTSRSFFQNASNNNSRYVMHDLISDLARKAAGEICFRLEDTRDSNMQSRCSPKARHSSYIAGKYDGFKKFEVFYELKFLRTFLPLSLSRYRCNYLTCKVTHELLPKLQCLRVLSFNGYQITELPNSIGELKHLRYLDLSHTQISDLPESTSSFYSLQTLILEGCTRLKALPTNMSNLTNLRHLHNSNVPSLKGMPVKLGRLTNLQTLCNFVVGKSRETGLREISPLFHLRGTLRLSRLENVNDVEDASRANFSSKDMLDEMILEWSEKSEMELDVLDVLEPHKKLKQLTIMGYGGLKFSAWIGDSSFSNMVFVRLENCNNCVLLPPLGQLSSLKELCIRRMPGVENVGPEFYGEGPLHFPVLQSLEFKGMDHWKEWLPCERDEENGVFPCLRMLSISHCPKLKGRVPENLDLLSKLVIYDCEQLVVSIVNYKQLRQLEVNNCKGVHTSAAEFELLETVMLSRIAEFNPQVEEFMKGLRKVKDLNITGCEELTSSWQPNEDRSLEHLISLHHLVIKSNSHLLQFRQLVLLQELHIYDCPSLISFQEVGLPPSLKELKIQGCSSLEYLERYQMPPSLMRIDILKCNNLKSLVEVEEEVESSSCVSSSLEYLRISHCPSLTSFPFKGHLPRTLKYLEIWGGKLASISDSFHDNPFLEEIVIFGCSNLKSLPEGLSDLTNLQSLSIRLCGSLVSFPSVGLPRSTSNLRQIVIDCDNLEALPRGMHYLNSLQILKIPDCEGFVPFLEEGGFPTNLIQLEILNLKSCKVLLELQGGLRRLTSLRQLTISGDDPDVVSFPPENDQTPLPKSLVQLSISGFPNLNKLSNGFQVLTSLQSLGIRNCPKLASMPEEGRLPLSLTGLWISGCALLEERCKPSKGPYWPSILHIPYIRIGGSCIERSSSLAENQPRSRPTHPIIKYFTPQTS